MRDLNNVLKKFIQEAMEVGLAASKAQEFGLESNYPNKNSPSKRELLIQEIGDFLACVDMLVEDTESKISRQDIEVARLIKHKKLLRYVPHLPEAPDDIYHFPTR